LYVVTGMQDCSLVGLSKQEDSDDSISTILPGQKVQVETSFVVRKKGMFISCCHTASVNRVRIAQGIVNMMALDETTRRPTNKLPQWMADKFNPVND